MEKKSRPSSHVKVTGQGEGQFSESSRSLDKLMSHAVASSEIPSAMASSSFLCLYVGNIGAWENEYALSP